MEIPLSNGGVTVIDDADYPLVCRYTWRWRQHKQKSKHAVASINKNKTATRMHRLLMGVTDPAIIVDHRDRDGLNNRRSNLRIASRIQSAANVGVRQISQTGFKGVRRDRFTGLWLAAIKHRNVTTFLGAFDALLPAALAYERAALSIHGEFACCPLLASYPPYT